MRRSQSRASNGHFKALIAALAAVLVFASPALAASWGIKFPSLPADVLVESTTPDAMSQLCKGGTVRNKTLSFERPAQDKTIQTIAAKQKAPLDEVTVRWKGRGSSACTLQVKSVMFTEWKIVALDAKDSTKAKERFTLAYAEAKAVQ